MLFPELREKVREIRSGFGSDLISLKQSGLVYDNYDWSWYARHGFRGPSDPGYSGRSWAGEHVSVDTAQNHSVVWACRRMIAEPVAFLPLVMMQETATGKYPAVEHPLYSALKNSPNAEQGAMEFREMLTGHVTMGGNAFAKIERRSGTDVAMALYPLMPANVQVSRERTGQKRVVYEVKEQYGPNQIYPIERDKPQDILHVRSLSSDGLTGLSIVANARQSIGTAIGAERFTGEFWGNGGRVPYMLKLDKPFKNEQDFDKFRADWEATYRDPHRAPILEPYLTYQQIGMSLHDCQLLEARQFSVPEICRWFGISPHLVFDLSHATFSNIEHLALQFVTFCLTAWLKRWEEALWRCVLTPAEKSRGYYFKHNVAGLLRGDFPTRMAGYASALQNGHMNVDEVRDLEDRNPLPDGAGENYHIQLNMQSISGTPTAAQQDLQQPGTQSTSGILRLNKPKKSAAPIELVTKPNGAIKESRQ